MIKKSTGYIVGAIVGIGLLSLLNRTSQTELEEVVPVATSAAVLVVPTVVPVAEPVVEEEIPGVREAYMEGCLGEDASRSYCRCTYNYMIRNLGVNKMYRMFMELDESDDTPDMMWDAVLYCLDE